VLLGDINAKVGREDIFKPKIGNGSLHKIINDNGVRVERRCFIATAFQLCVRKCYSEGPGKPDGTEIKCDMSAADPY
jgi:hypothetical protein